MADLSPPALLLLAGAAAAVVLLIPVVMFAAWWREQRDEPAPPPPPAPTPPAEAVRRAGGQLLGAREVQEDDLGFIDSPGLDPGGQHPVALVADGMGGHARGDVASQLAVRAFVEGYGAAGPAASRLRAALDRANEAIAEAVRNDPDLENMGTTLVAAALTADGLDWISVGDSLLFLHRDGKLTRLNADHSMAPVIDAVRKVDPAVAAGMNPHELRSALMGGDIAKVDASTAPRPLQPGDVVLLASDGLGTLDDAETASIIEASRAGGQDAVKDALLQAVEAHGNPRQDNVSVALIEVLATPEAVDANDVESD